MGKYEVERLVSIISYFSVQKILDWNLKIFNYSVKVIDIFVFCAQALD